MNNERPLCQRQFCNKPAAPKQRYCSRDHAPYGNYDRYGNIESEETEKSTSNVHTDLSEASSSYEESTISGGKKIESTQQKENNLRPPEQNTITQIERDSQLTKEESGESYQRQSEKKDLKKECFVIEQQGKNEMSEQDKTMLQIESVPVQRYSENGDGERITNLQSNNQSNSLSEARLQSVNLIDESITQLHILMKSISTATPKIHPVQGIQATCNCAKQIATLLRLKLDIVKEMVKMQEKR